MSRAPAACQASQARSTGSPGIRKDRSSSLSLRMSATRAPPRPSAVGLPGGQAGPYVRDRSRPWRARGRPPRTPPPRRRPARLTSASEPVCRQDHPVGSTRGEFRGGPLPVGGALGVEAVGGLAAARPGRPPPGCSARRRRRRPTGPPRRRQVVAEQRAEHVAGQAAEEPRRGAEPGQSHRRVRGAAARQHPRSSSSPGAPVREGVRDAFAQDSDHQGQPFSLFADLLRREGIDVSWKRSPSSQHGECQR